MVQVWGFIPDLSDFISFNLCLPVSKYAHAASLEIYLCNPFYFEEELEDSLQNIRYGNLTRYDWCICSSTCKKMSIAHIVIENMPHTALKLSTDHPVPVENPVSDFLELSKLRSSMMIS